MTRDWNAVWRIIYVGSVWSIAPRDFYGNQFRLLEDRIIILETGNIFYSSTFLKDHHTAYLIVDGEKQIFSGKNLKRALKKIANSNFEIRLLDPKLALEEYGIPEFCHSYEIIEK